MCSSARLRFGTPGIPGTAVRAIPPVPTGSPNGAWGRNPGRAVAEVVSSACVLLLAADTVVWCRNPVFQLEVRIGCRHGTARSSQGVAP